MFLSRYVYKITLLNERWFLRYLEVSWLENGPHPLVKQWTIEKESASIHMSNTPKWRASKIPSRIACSLTSKVEHSPWEEENAQIKCTVKLHMVPHHLQVHPWCINRCCSHLTHLKWSSLYFKKPSFMAKVRINTTCTWCKRSRWSGVGFKTYFLYLIN